MEFLVGVLFGLAFGLTISHYYECLLAWWKNEKTKHDL